MLGLIHEANSGKVYKLLAMAVESSTWSRYAAKLHLASAFGYPGIGFIALMCASVHYRPFC